MKRQQNHLESYVTRKRWTVVRTYQDIGSKLNDGRKGLLRLIRELPVLQPDYLVCSYNDRLARFGTKVIKTICGIYDTKIIITHETEMSESLDGQLVKDVIAVITSFAGKLYRRRRGKLT